MARNDFLVAWLFVATLLLILVVGGTVFFVWRSGLLSGEVPVVETTSELAPYLQSEEESADEENGSPGAGPGLTVPVYCVDPVRESLVSETRNVTGASHDSGRLLNILRSLNRPPSTPGWVAAVPPDLQFRAVFIIRDEDLVCIDLANLPDSWNGAGPVEVGLSLYAIVHTITGITNYSQVRFLVGGKESGEKPGGFLLTESFTADEDWLGEQATE